ncbi:hypothetical protein HUG10_02215 [Halorarum halophilum]|uniref:DUF7344 domain-containing protein n=1 Tax=Halorarum halophilum TaxID=2743090 RepID=A0A7D5GIW0_9EURY|nr:hypothetical protein [Halobaculum halophilum]QLG26424.1 hypothetical protein HUG10_02215 [Halobaculum halophilum]
MSDDDFAKYEGEDKPGENGTRPSDSVRLRSDIGTSEGADTTGQLLRTLANERRRSVLATLRESEEEVASLADLTTELVRDDAEGKETPVEQRLERVAVSLHHAHLPKLEASGLVEYDEQAGVVRYRGSTAADALVAFVTDEEP